MGGRIKYGTHRRRVAVSSANIGALGELLASADLIRRGYHVYRALSPSSPCDLLAMKNDKTFRVEVTKGRRRLNNELGWNKHDSSRYDLLIIWEDNGLITYPEQQPM